MFPGPFHLGMIHPLPRTTMKNISTPLRRIAIACVIVSTPIQVIQANVQPPSLTSEGVFQTPGWEVLVFCNWYDGLFSDAKISSVEMIHHGERTVTNGDVRLDVTPEQWDAIPTFKERNIDESSGKVTARLHYPEHDWDYAIVVEPTGKPLQLKLRVEIDSPVPEALQGRAGFNLEFLPSAYFGKTFVVSDHAQAFPLYPAGNVEVLDDGRVQATPLATGATFVMAPEDVSRRIRITSESSGKLALYDGRSKAQNGWFVLRETLPSDVTGTVIEWTIEGSAISDWVRKPVIAHSQVGYRPQDLKVAMLEMDPNAAISGPIELIRIQPSGERERVLQWTPESPQRYLRYDYYRFDFSEVSESGLYQIQYDGVTTAAFPIRQPAYDAAWHATLDVFFPVQMDHMFVNEAYRVWHGASHLDDALQAPPNHEHFDLYAMGPSTDTEFEPGETIPGLNIGGWYDAGDYDIRTQTQYAVVLNLVRLAEQYGVTRDNTSVNWDTREVELHQPDGTCDLLQQIKHGTLALIAQHRAVGHAIPGIVAAHLHQYTHLGDGVTKTDNRFYDASLGEQEVDGDRSGKFDDRWAFTTHTTALNYGSAAALAAASRVLGEIDPDLAIECLETATRVWAYEQTHEPATFRWGNTTGGRIESEQLKAAVELWLATRESRYLETVQALIPDRAQSFMWDAANFLRVYADLPEQAQQRIRALSLELRDFMEPMLHENPFAVPITRGGWAGNGAVVGYGLTQHALHQVFPDEFDGSGTLRSLHYLLGTHPGSDLSFVSAVGARSQQVAYGTNRADFSFIAGGVVPGVLILKPDFPENKDDWPFFWGQNEYVVNVASSYMLLVHAARSL